MGAIANLSCNSTEKKYLLVMAHYIHIRNIQYYARDDENQYERRPRVFRERMNPLDVYTDDEIKKRYRLTRELIVCLHELIHHDIEPKTRRNKAIPAMPQILNVHFDITHVEASKLSWEMVLAFIDQQSVGS